jgi:hypothetical protein
MASFLDETLDLGIDLADLDAAIAAQNDRLAEMRRRLPELDGYIRKIENNEGLTHDEGQKLVKGVEQFLRRIV